MRAYWTEEAQAACTTGHVVCAEVGCVRTVYRQGRCSQHWEPPKERGCRHHKAAVRIRCGRCGRRVCEECYGPWNALACVDCRSR